MALLLHYEFDTADSLDGWTIVTSSGGTLEWQDSVGRDNTGGIFRRHDSYATIPTGLSILEAGQSIFCGMWIKKTASPTDWRSYNMSMFQAFLSGIRMSDGVLLIQLSVGTTTTVISGLASANMNLNQWYYVIFEFRRASAAGVADGGFRVWKDGVLIGDKCIYDNYGRTSLSTFCLGSYLTASTSGDYIFDDVRIGETLADVEPARPAVDGELPQSARMLVLFNRNSADSESFARSLVPDTNIVSLPCSSDETLTDYATFQAEIETPLKEFLAARPLLASQITCIIAGYMVPGYFYSGNYLLTTCSRLMDIDNAFSANKTNPLYGTSGRLTATVLQTAGVRLAARVDGTTMADCQLLKTIGDATVMIEEGKTVFMSGTPTLDVQLLRLPIKQLAAGDVISDDVLNFNIPPVSGISTVSADEPGSRLAIILNNATDITRGELAYATADWHYRAMIFSSGRYAFDFSAFCGMLRDGGTIAEAFAVACEKIDAKYQLGAWPLLRAVFPKAGYNVYLGNGAQSDIDYSQIYAALPISTTDFEIKIPNQPDFTRVMCVRKTSEYGMEETRGRIVMLESDSDGLINLQLPIPYDLTTRETGENNVELSFSCFVDEGQEQPSLFEILGDNGSGKIDIANPLAEIPFNNDEREYSVIITAATRPAIFAVRAKLENRKGKQTDAITVLPLRIPVQPEVLI
ncbi:MAG TPA: hypothetical protein PKK48_04230 [Phycisphaerae bacterium]|nr:hypothetical protein [Phycisphaerae bacterium]HPS52916.1 hypothetical protein [Phycisphaerae bacterium]